MKNIFILCLFLITTGQAISQIQTINVGTSANDRTGDPIRTAFQKTNSNFSFEDLRIDSVSNRVDSLLDAGIGGTWGTITGTISNQTDLIGLFDAEQSAREDADATLTQSINQVASDLTDNLTDFSNQLSAITSDLDAHTSNISNPHGVTKTQVGLGNVDNTSDANKPISTATQTALDLKDSYTEYFYIAFSDPTTAIAAGTNKAYFDVPATFIVTEVAATVFTAQSSGSILTIDINEGVTSILSTKITLDNNETSSATALTAPVISDSSIAANARITIDVDQVGTGAVWGQVRIGGHF